MPKLNNTAVTSQCSNAQNNANKDWATPIFWQYPDVLHDIAEKQNSHAKANACDTANFAKLCEP